jgi:hypothetical protein
MYNISGHETGVQLADLAADKAGDEWKISAYDAIVRHAKQYNEFTIEDVRNSNLDLPSPPTERAWGSVTIKAKKNKVITKAGTTSVQNGRMIAVLWRSNIKV